MENNQYIDSQDQNTIKITDQNVQNDQLSEQNSSLQQQPKNQKFMIILITAIVIMVAGGFWVVKSQKYQANTPGTVVTQMDASPSPDSNIPVDQTAPTLDMNPLKINETVAFTKEDSFELWVNQNGSETKISSDNEALGSYAVSKQQDRIVYTYGDLKSNVNGYKYTYPNTVLLYDLELKKSKKILTVENTVFADKDNYITHVTNVVFSDDGKYIAISASQEIYLYTVATGTIKKIASTQPDPNDRWLSIYDVLAFSPDNSKLLFRWAYYEGSSWSVLDVATGKETKLSSDYNGYNGAIIGWLNNQELLATKDNEPQDADILTSINVATGQEKIHQEFTGAAVRLSYIVFPYVYFVINNYASLEQTPMQKFVVYDLRDNTADYFNLPTTAPSGDQLSLHGPMRLINDKQIIMEGTHVTNRLDIFIYDLETNRLHVFKEGAQMSPQF